MYGILVKLGYQFNSILNWICTTEHSSNMFDHVYDGDQFILMDSKNMEQKKRYYFINQIY